MAACYELVSLLQALNYCHVPGAISLSLLDTYILQDTPVSCLPALPATHSIGQALLRPPVPRVLIADTCAALQLHLSNCL